MWDYKLLNYCGNSFNVQKVDDSYYPYSYYPETNAISSGSFFLNSNFIGFAFFHPEYLFCCQGFTGASCIIPSLEVDLFPFRKTERRKGRHHDTAPKAGPPPPSFCVMSMGLNPWAVLREPHLKYFCLVPYSHIYSLKASWNLDEWICSSY